jgi:hypothetical protein
MEAGNTAPVFSGRPPELEIRDVLGVEPRQIRVFRDDNQQIRVTLLDDRSYLHVKAMAAFPLSNPASFIGLADGQNKQICMVQDLSDLDPESQERVKELLEVRYFAPRITGVNYAKDEFGVIQWKVETDRGPREFFVRNLRDSLMDLPEGEQLLTDVDGNRFIVPDLTTLDRDSRVKILTVF